MRMSTRKRNRQRVDRQGRKLHGWIQGEVGKRLREEAMLKLDAFEEGVVTPAPIGIEHFVNEEVARYCLAPWWLRFWLRLKNLWLRLLYPSSYIGAVEIHESWWYRICRKICQFAMRRLRRGGYYDRKNW